MSKHGEWIDVKDNTPSSSDDVLVVLSDRSSNSRITIGWYDKFMDSWSNPDSGKSLDVVLWKHLPVNPLEASNEVD